MKQIVLTNYLKKIRGKSFIITLENQKRTKYSHIKQAMYPQRKL